MVKMKIDILSLIFNLSKDFEEIIIQISKIIIFQDEI